MFQDRAISCRNKPFGCGSKHGPLGHHVRVVSVSLVKQGVLRILTHSHSAQSSSAEHLICKDPGDWDSFQPHSLRIRSNLGRPRSHLLRSRFVCSNCYFIHLWQLTSRSADWVVKNTRLFLLKESRLVLYSDRRHSSLELLCTRCVARLAVA